VLSLVHRSEGMGLARLQATVDLPALRKRINAVSDHLRASVCDLLDDQGVRVIRGTARMKGPHEVVAETEDGLVELSADAGDSRFLLGTDDQGRDLFSIILYGTRASIFIGVCSVLVALAIGVTLGLVAGYFGGRIDMVLMRIADVQLTFPAILTAWPRFGARATRPS